MGSGVVGLAVGVAAAAGSGLVGLGVDEVRLLLSKLGLLRLRLRLGGRLLLMKLVLVVKVRRRLRMKVIVDEILILVPVVRVQVLQLLLLLVDAGQRVLHERRAKWLRIGELLLVQLARVQVLRVLREHQLRGRAHRVRLVVLVWSLVVLASAHGRAGLLGVARQVIFAAEARVAGRTDMLAKAQVSVLVASEIFGREELLVALGAAELAVLRWP